jgi:YesN/AraC family two-component response regulator
MTNELTLLYIEDDVEILDNVSFLLERYVKKVYTAKDGQEGLDLYKKYKQDIIVTDISVPKIDGLSVAEQIRNIDKNTPIIIISAYDEDHQVQKANELKVSTYLKKPFTLQQLKDAMTKVLEETGL